MAVSNRKATFQSDIQKVWKVVTDVANYTWRRDLGRTEVLNEKQFVEYTKDGYATTFTITVEKPCERWEFDIFMKPFVKAYLKKQQAQFISDLKKGLAQ